MNPLPQSKDIAFFRDHGWWLSPPIFTDAELDAAIREQDRFYAGSHDHPSPIAHMRYPGWNPETGTAHELRKNDYAFIQNPLFATLIIGKPAIAQIAATLMGVEGVRLWHDQLLFKPPLPAAEGGIGELVSVGWHTDHGYWRCCTGPMITAWVPFTEVTAEMGPVTMIDGSHAWPEAEGLDFFSNDLDGQRQRFTRAGQNVDEVPMLMQRGQVSFHDWRTIHGSRPNIGNRPRRALAIHLQALENRWRSVTDPKTGEQFEHVNDHLVRRDADGHPDYTDPHFCPVLPLPLASRA
ncbi:MAG: hypothetical protein Tsb0016_18590 [Sphingomonadales bacterium]